MHDTTNGDDPAAGAPEPELSDSLKTFGAVLKALRDEAHLTQEQFAPRVGYSPHYVAKIEQGKRFPPSDLAPRAEDPLGPVASRVLTAAIRSLRRKAGLATWFHQWANIEEEAVTLHAYECTVIPGLLQPDAYIRALFDQRLPPLTTDQLERQVEARQARQQLLESRPNTQFSFVIEQALLERRFGGTDVARQLLDNLLEQGERRNVEVQLMPLQQVDHAGLDGPFRLAETPDNTWIGYIEAQDTSMLVTDAKRVSAMHQRYGRMRSQAMSHHASASRLREMRGAL
ncbi:helix-turn-helix transcriptional regulator [Streptomyces sp. P38-E01]|uniref:Helix-turn-helix transcriptional regulator n=2 Tax=Streptomyces tardus TaxID=2780544 RepID=A0A949JSP3_9ACTN|nr:helix-turn-helix transcriptional regulator [Streptomyces tardus]